MGNGMAAQTWNIPDLLLSGVAGLGLLGSTIGAIAGAANGGWNGAGLLAQFRGVSAANSVSRGVSNALGITSGTSVSSSGYIGNSSSSDIYNSTMTSTTDEANATTAEAVEENESATTDDINNNILMIYEVISEIASGQKTINVSVEDVSEMAATAIGSAISV